MESRPPRPAPLAIAAFLCRSVHGIEALPHVTDLVSAFVDYATPTFWSIERACERNDLRLLKRIAACESSDVDPFFKAFDASKSLAVAARNGNLEVVRWICLEYCPWVIPMKGIDEAVKRGDRPLLEWIFTNVATARWTKKMAEIATENGHLEILQWVLAHLETERVEDRLVVDLIHKAAAFGHVQMFTWLLREINPPEIQSACPYNYGSLWNALRNGHFEIAEYIIDQDKSLQVAERHLVAQFARIGNLELVQRV